MQVPRCGRVMSFVVGLTGGIGCGKSTVADLFAERGVAVVDSDVIAHELTGVRGGAMPEIGAAFGDAVLSPDGSLDRVAMRRRVFSDPTARARLEAILHPRIRRESEVRCQAERLAATGSPYAMLVVPLLVESNAYRDRVNRILVVDCDEEVQVSRVMTRSALSAAEVRAIMATQASRAERLAVADDIVLNNDGKDRLVHQVTVLHRRYLELAVQDSR